MSVRTLPPAVMITVVALFGCSRGGPDTPLVCAVLLLSEEKLPEALIQCDQALSAEPTNCQAWLLRGEINQRAGNFEQALTDYSRALELDPENSDAHYYRSALLELQGRAKPHEDQRYKNGLEPVPPLAADVVPTLHVEDSRPHADDRTRPADDSYEVRYGLAELPSKPNGYQEEVRPTPAPADTPYRRWLKKRADRPRREVAEVLNPAAMPLEYYDQQEELPSAPPPPQLTGFGYQLGDRLPGLPQRPPPTTGRRRRREATPPERCAQFIGQRVPLRRLRTTSRALPDFGFACSPLSRENAGSWALSPSCSDQLDNDGNGYADRSDPACWRDGINPNTYSPRLYEVGVSPVIAPLPATTPPQGTIAGGVR